MRLACPASTTTWANSLLGGDHLTAQLRFPSRMTESPGGTPTSTPPRNPGQILKCCSAHKCRQHLCAEHKWMMDLFPYPKATGNKLSLIFQFFFFTFTGKKIQCTGSKKGKVSHYSGIYFRTLQSYSYLWCPLFLSSFSRLLFLSNWTCIVRNIWRE